MNWHRRRSMVLLLCLTVANLCSPVLVRAQQSGIDFNSLMIEVQKVSANPDALTVVWWMPEEFWRASNEGSGFTEQQVDEMIAVLNQYTFVTVVDGTIGPFGGVSYVAEPDLRRSVLLLDANGTAYPPLHDKDIDPDTRNMVSFLGPMWAQMLGEMGQHTVLLVFPATDDEGNRIADATGEGRFSIKVGEELFSWRLPLGSLVPQKMCPVDGELMNGAWRYCPWHGVELVDVVDTSGAVQPSDDTAPELFSTTDSMRLVDELPERRYCPPPEYPRHLHMSGIEGRITLSMVVDTAGHVEDNTIEVVEINNQAFKYTATTMARGYIFPRDVWMVGQFVR